MLAGLMMLLAGCASYPRKGGDPLFGLPAPKPAEGGGSKPPPANAGASLAPPVSATSPAALAATTPRALDGGTELRIGGSANPTAPSPSLAGWQAPSRGGGPTLPPADLTSRRDPSLPPNAAPVHPSQVTTYEQAQALLLARGVKWQRLETWGDRGEWKFSCSIPNPKNPFISRTYEGRASDYLAAVRAVLNQIENDPN
ncbi:MAG: hypothetical protein NZ700_18255 [Gemmataceae bacterium]|nr:hypothetical protein [Gemmataceae bacterium]MDW8265479.1 hypothetical protein [Gemmataceae bacterium]